MRAYKGVEMSDAKCWLGKNEIEKDDLALWSKGEHTIQEIVSKSSVRTIHIHYFWASNEGTEWDEELDVISFDDSIHSRLFPNFALVLSDEL